MLPRSWPGRLIVVAVAIRLVNYLLGLLVGPLPQVLAAIDTGAAIAIAVGAGVYVVRSLAAMKRRLLWRVRRKLIVSYIFIGLVPVALVAAFFVLGGVLLFFNFSAYLVRSEFLALGERARVEAHEIAIEIERREGRDMALMVNEHASRLMQDLPATSIAVIPVDRACTGSRAAALDQKVAAPPIATAGAWSHVDPPAIIPDWIGCAGFGGLLAYGQPPKTDEARPSGPGTGLLQGVTATDTGLLVRGVGFPDTARPAYAVVVDFVVDSTVAQSIRDNVGAAPERVSRLSAEIGVLPARPSNTPGAMLLPDTDLPLPSIAWPRYYDWLTGKWDILTTDIRLNIPEIYWKITASPGQTRNEVVIVLLQIVGVLFLVIEAFALIVGLTLAKSITGSVHELFMGTERVRRGDFSHKIAATADDQLGELAQSFNSMTASIEDLLEEAAEKKRLEEELRIAHEIQMSLLPQGPLRMPGISLTAICVPAREVGGDYYDFLPIDEYRLGILIADVSGKGTSAALYMAELKGLVLSLSRIHTSPRALLIDANRIIAKHLDARSFITVTYAVVDLKARTMTYARAGHTPLMQVPATQGSRPGRARILVPGGMVLGLKLDAGEMFERLLEEEVVPLNVGDLYLFFTDGITDAMNVHDDYFGEARLGRLLEEHAHLPPEELRERVLREIGAFAGDVPQQDDMTMILLRVEEMDRGAPAAVEAEPVAAEPV
jgi:serine phosphatase RsbU (regulator of sigma subunit)